MTISKTPPGAFFVAKLDYFPRDHDIAILAIEGMDEIAVPLQLFLKQGLNVGEPVFAVGSPQGLESSLTSGVVSALRKDYLQTDATVYFSSSGGPYVN